MPSCNPSLSNIRDVVSCEILKFLAIPLLLAPDCSLISCRTVSSTASVHAHRRLFRLILIAANDPLSHSCRWMRENIWWCGTGRLGKRAASNCLARRHLLLLSNDDWLHASNSYAYLTLCGTRKLQFFYVEILPEFKNRHMPKIVNAICKQIIIKKII